MELMMPSKVRKVGGSHVIGLPADIVRMLEVGAGQQVVVSAVDSRKEIRILLE